MNDVDRIEAENEFFRIVETCAGCDRVIRKSRISIDKLLFRQNLLFHGALSEKPCCGEIKTSFEGLDRADVLHQANRVPALERTIGGLQKMLNKRNAA